MQHPTYKKESWKHFSNLGLLWYVNRLLHFFGWTIVLVQENGEVVDAYPAKTDARGFSEKSEERGYDRISKNFIKD